MIVLRIEIPNDGIGAVYTVVNDQGQEVYRHHADDGGTFRAVGVTYLMTAYDMFDAAESLVKIRRGDRGQG